MPYSIVGMIHLSWKPIGSNEYANTNISTKGGRFPAVSQFDENPYIILSSKLAIFISFMLTQARCSNCAE